MSVEASSATWRAVKATAQKMKEDATQALIAGRENDDRCRGVIDAMDRILSLEGAQENSVQAGEFY